jgi:hypothetical protein
MSDHELIRRARAAQATLDAWERRGWRLGTADCVRMIASHLRRLGYHVRLPPAGAYRTVRAAEDALDRRGFRRVTDALDALGMIRIPPAAALAADIIELPSDDADPRLVSDRLPTLAIALGNGRVFGWHDDAPQGAVVMQPLQMVAAWRVTLR